jgi:hypothetical protein
MQYSLLKTPVYDKMIQDFSMTYKEFKDRYVSRRILTEYGNLPIPDTQIVVAPVGGFHTLAKYDLELMNKGAESYAKASEIVSKWNNHIFIPSSTSGYQLTLSPTKDIFSNLKLKEILINYFQMMDEKTDEWKGGKRKTRKASKGKKTRKIRRS